MTSGFISENFIKYRIQYIKSVDKFIKFQLHKNSFLIFFAFFIPQKIVGLSQLNSLADLNCVAVESQNSLCTDGPQRLPPCEVV